MRATSRIPARPASKELKSPRLDIRGRWVRSPSPADDTLQNDLGYPFSQFITLWIFIANETWLPGQLTLGEK